MPPRRNNSATFERMPENGEDATNTRRGSDSSINGVDASTFLPPSPGQSSKALVPHVPSLCVVMAFTFITVTCFTITLPTVQQYLRLLGAPDTLVGLVVGLTPFGAGAMQIPISFVLEKVTMRCILICYALILITSQILYAAAGMTGTAATLLIARTVAGMISGPQLLTTYVARTTDLTNRSKYMLRVAITVAAGYAAGPLIGGAIELFCDHLNWHIPDAPPSPANLRDTSTLLRYLFNSATLPGWVMASLTTIELIFIVALFREPPRPGAPPPNVVTPNDTPLAAGAESAGVVPADPPVPYRQIAVCLFVGMVWPINISGWQVCDKASKLLPTRPQPCHTRLFSRLTCAPPHPTPPQVHTIHRVIYVWHWPAWTLAVYLFAMLITGVPIAMVDFASCMSDSVGLLVMLTGSIVGLVCFFGCARGVLNRSHPRGCHVDGPQTHGCQNHTPNPRACMRATHVPA